MKLRFGKVHHGWLPTTLEIDGVTLIFDVSYVPYDFVAELVAAVSGVLSGPGEYVARAYEEPTEHEWRFHSVDPLSVAFEVVIYRRGRADRGEVVAEWRGPPLGIVLPIWRGLRDLSSRAEAEDYRSHWNEPFPSDALGRLTERVDYDRGKLS